MYLLKYWSKSNHKNGICFLIETKQFLLFIMFYHWKMDQIQNYFQNTLCWSKYSPNLECQTAQPKSLTIQTSLDNLGVEIWMVWGLGWTVWKWRFWDLRVFYPCQYLVHFLQKYHPSTSPAKTDEEPVGPYSPLILLPPALCDVTATSVMYIALTLTRFVAKRLCLQCRPCV